MPKTRVTPFEGQTFSIRQSGENTALVMGDEIIVQDNPRNRPYLAKKLEEVFGSVVLFGLGLGTTLGLLLQKADQITVVEINPELLNYTSQFYPEKNIRYILADCTTWKPDRRFDWVIDTTKNTIVKPFQRG